MKKKKMWIAVAASLAFVLAGFGAYEAYVPSDVAMSDQDLMVIENVLALTEYQNPVENGTVEIVSSTFTCHKLATDMSDKQTATVNVDGVDKEVVYYRHYDEKKTAANCKVISVREYNKQRLCEKNMLRNCKQYGGTVEAIDPSLLGYY